MFKKPYHIVIIDDEPDIGYIVEQLIQDCYKTDFITHTFTSSDLALQHITSHEVMIVLSDLEMPGLHGLDLIQKVNQLNRGIQIIVMTGQHSYSGAMECFMSGAQGYITKPMTKKQIKSAIDQCLQRFDYWNRILNEVEAI